MYLINDINQQSTTWWVFLSFASCFFVWLGSWWQSWNTVLIWNDKLTSAIKFIYCISYDVYHDFCTLKTPYQCFLLLTCCCHKSTEAQTTTRECMMHNFVTIASILVTTKPSIASCDHYSLKMLQKKLKWIINHHLQDITVSAVQAFSTPYKKRKCHFSKKW